MEHKVLIAYYSRRGENYAGGRIVNLAVGNTEIVAQKIADITGGDIFHIDTVEPYPESYDECVKVAVRELKGNARPVLSGEVKDMTHYDTVFLGYPNWCGTMPMAVWTFLETYDFAGKVIVPFCTNEGSGMGRSVDDIGRLCPSAHVMRGVSIRGTAAAESDAVIRQMIESILK